MIRKMIYRYQRPDGGYTVSPVKPDVQYQVRWRLIAEEGMAKGAVNCHRVLASFMTQEEFQVLPEEKQKELHEEMDRGLRYAVEHYDRRACYLLAFYVYFGQMGYETNTAEAIAPYSDMQISDYQSKRDSQTFFAVIAHG